MLTYKYAKYETLDEERKLAALKAKKKAEAEDPVNDDLDDGLLRKELAEIEDKWEENKDNKETLAVFNYRVKANKYL